MVLSFLINIIQTVLLHHVKVKMMKLPLFNKKEVDSCLPIFSSLECVLVKMKGPKRGLNL